MLHKLLQHKPIPWGKPPSWTTSRVRGPTTEAAIATQPRQELRAEIGTHHMAGQTPDTMSVLPDCDVQAILQPLPPGWVRDEGFTQGLHPVTDVFDREAELPDTIPQHRAYDKSGPAGPVLGDVSPCDKGADELPRHPQEGTHPTVPACSVPSGWDDASSDYDVQDATQEECCEKGATPSDLGASVPEPEGTPSRFSAQQKARRQELLQKRDSDGNLPYGLDRYANDEEMWQAYRQNSKASYRAHRKRTRADGTWNKDDNRGWGSTQGSEGHSRGRQPHPRPREHHCREEDPRTYPEG